MGASAAIETFRARRRRERALYGMPEVLAASVFGLAHDLLVHGRIGKYVWHSRRLQGWVRGREAVELAKASERLTATPTVVEIGSFLGCSTVLLAGPCKMRGSGRVHCIDPFAASGDAFSEPIYQEIADSLGVPLRQRFERNIRRAGLSPGGSRSMGRADRSALSRRRPVTRRIKRHVPWLEQVSEGRWRSCDQQFVRRTIGTRRVVPRGEGVRSITQLRPH
jgi:hypothetical protein